MYKIIGADGKEYGPVPIDVVRRWLAEGRANAQTRVLPEGATEWKTIGELPEFAAEPMGTVPQPIRPLQQPGTAPVNNSLAVIGLVLGIISIPFSLCCYGLPFNIAGIIVSLVALVQIKEGKQQGRGQAIAGLMLSILSILIAILMLIFTFAWGFRGPMHGIHRL